MDMHCQSPAAAAHTGCVLPEQGLRPRPPRQEYMTLCMVQVEHKMTSPLLTTSCSGQSSAVGMTRSMSMTPWRLVAESARPSLSEHVRSPSCTSSRLLHTSRESPPGHAHLLPYACADRDQEFTCIRGGGLRFIFGNLHALAERGLMTVDYLLNQDLEPLPCRHDGMDLHYTEAIASACRACM